jgi:hypothetical protein
MGLKYVEDRIICKVDPEQKNNFTFSDGTTIRLERGFDNFDRKYTEQVMGLAVSAENIPTDAFVLFHHNSLHQSYEIFNHSKLSGEEVTSGIKFFSIMERDCFFWKLVGDKEWHPAGNYDKALRVFKPYSGVMQGIEPTLIPDTLYVLTGDFKGQVVRTVKASDYQITFRDPQTGRDEKIIRFRPNGCEKENREPEAIAILHEETEQVETGILLIGFSVSDCKPINE